MVPIEHVYDQIRAFAADAGARKVVLFGSRAKGVNGLKAISILPWPVVPISIAWSRTFRTICGHCLKLMSSIWMSRFLHAEGGD